MRARAACCHRLRAAPNRAPASPAHRHLLGTQPDHLVAADALHAPQRRQLQRLSGQRRRQAAAGRGASHCHQACRSHRRQQLAAAELRAAAAGLGAWRRRRRRCRHPAALSAGRPKRGAPNAARLRGHGWRKQLTCGACGQEPYYRSAGRRDGCAAMIGTGTPEARCVSSLAWRRPAHAVPAAAAAGHARTPWLSCTLTQSAAGKAGCYSVFNRSSGVGRGSGST